MPSARAASARLQFARLAFGAAGSAGAMIDLGDAGNVANGFLNRLLVVNTREEPRVEDPRRWKRIPDRLKEWLIEYGQAIAEDPKHVPEELFAKLKANFTEEEIVVITAMGVMMIANNYFNDILDVTPDKLV